ncbi:MAG TPA: alkaline phosphatase family protein [Kofleriaceae bacterium]|nr:alkaline phosphatase family protein [Kofleriaceae bacterium]
MRRFAVSLVVAGVAACNPNDSGSTFVTCDKLTPAPAVSPPGWQGTVFTIAMENHSRHQIYGNTDAPFINRLAKPAALANGYHDPYVHPSEANYLWMVSGENFGVLDDDDPSSHHFDSKSHMADQLEMGGVSWKSYQESMGSPCGLVSHGRYAAKHNPFVFFDDVNGWDGSQFARSQRCIDHVVDYSQLDKDIAANKLPRYVFITPNLDDNMHDGSIAEGDAWLAHEIPKIMATDAYQNGGAIFLLWDEGGGTPANDDPPFMVLSPNAKAGFTSNVDYDTSSYVKTVESVLGLGSLPCDLEASSVNTMADLFAIPVSAPSKVAPELARQ